MAKSLFIFLFFFFSFLGLTTTRWSAEKYYITLSIAERKAVGFIPAWSLAFLHSTPQKA